MKSLAKWMILFATLILFLAPICFAQKKTLAKVVHGAGREQLAHQVTQKVLPAINQKTSVQLVRITNYAEKPFLRIYSATMMDSPNKILPAKVINGELFRQDVFPEPGLRRLPVALNDSSPALYRGMNLSIKHVKNLLINGIELDKSYFPQLYFSADIDIALASANEENLLLPVVVKVNVTPELQESYPPHLHEDDNYVFNQTIPVKYISDVLTFLEVAGERNWYKVTLTDGELLFNPVRTSIFPKRELIKHRFTPALGASDVSLRSLWEDLANGREW